MDQFKEQQGFVTFALNSDQTNYLELAYLQALNIKATQQLNSYAVIVDSNTNKLMTAKHRKVFDYIIVCPPTDKPFGIEPYVGNLTPFKETIKLESDLLFTRSIDHWWTAFRLKNICLSSGAKNYRQQASRVRKYRKLFDDNNLPDIYNGLMYFRYTQESVNFFNTAKQVFNNWDTIKDTLKNCREDTPSTDVLYAITALLIGEEICTAPSLDFINFVHMKSGMQGWSDARSWIETVLDERDGDIIRINNLNQYDPVHYYDKMYATEELIKYYESRRA